MRTQLALGRKALRTGDAAKALAHFEAALQTPENLGEAKHLLVNQSNIHYWCGVAAMANGDSRGATDWWTRAAEAHGDFQQMSAKAISEMTYYDAMALHRLGGTKKLLSGLKEILEYWKSSRMGC